MRITDFVPSTAKLRRGSAAASRIAAIAVIAVLFLVTSSLTTWLILEKPFVKPASVFKVTIQPSNPRCTDGLECQVKDVPTSYSNGHTLTYAYAWYKDGTLQSGLTTNSVQAGCVHKNEKWKCSVTVSNEIQETLHGSSDDVTIANSLPPSPVISIEPKSPVAGDSLKCGIIAQEADPDGDKITYKYEWYKSDELQKELTGDTVPADHTSKDEKWKCAVTANDGTDDSSTVYDTATVGDSSSTSPGTSVPLLRFVQITDTQISSASSAEVISQAAADIVKLPSSPAFVIHTGDIASTPSSTAFKYYSDRITAFPCQVYSAIGNQDDYGDAAKTLFETNAGYKGQRNYSFDIAQYHFIVLDSTKPDSLVTLGGGFDKETLDWLDTHLKTVDRNKAIVVFTHHAFWSPFQYDPQNNLFCDVENGDDVMKRFENYNLVAVFAGHAHQSMQYTRPADDKHKEILFHISGAMRSGTTNEDQSKPGYSIVELYQDKIETYYVPVGEIESCYIKPKTNVVTVAQDGSGEYNGTTEKPIQDAINDLHALGGGTVIIKSGTYTLTGTDASQYYRSISMYDNIWLKGAGNPVLKFCDRSGNKRAITCSDYVSNVRIEDLIIDCNGANSVPGADHTWYNAIEMDGGWSKDGPTADGDMVKDIVIERVTVRDCPSRGIVSYGGRRWSIRDCVFNDVYNPISPDHWTDYWQIEGNTMTASGVGIELNDTANSVIFNNTIEGATVKGMDLWPDTSLSDANGMAGNKVVGNRIRNVIGGYGIDVHMLNADHCEIIGNVLENVAGVGIDLPYYASTPALGPDWVLSNNTYNNVATPEFYGVRLTTPTSLEFSSITSTSITVRALGAASANGSLQYVFEARDYSQPGVPPKTLSSGAVTGDTYTFTNLVPGHVYAFRCSARSSTTTAWTEWYFPTLQ